MDAILKVYNLEANIYVYVGVDLFLFTIISIFWYYVSFSRV